SPMALSSDGRRVVRLRHLPHKQRVSTLKSLDCLRLRSTTPSLGNYWETGRYRFGPKLEQASMVKKRSGSGKGAVVENYTLRAPARAAPRCARAVIEHQEALWLAGEELDDFGLLWRSDAKTSA